MWIVTGGGVKYNDKRMAAKCVVGLLRETFNGLYWELIWKGEKRVISFDK